MRAFQFLHFLTLAFGLVWASSHKVLIDDAVGNDQVTYYGKWKDQNCILNGACAMIVDLERLYNRTYSAITVDKGSAAYFDVRFEGTGIDVYFMLPNNLSGQPPNDEKAYFILDGETDGPPFIWTAQNTSEIEYNQRIYSKTGLHQSMHTLRVGLPNATQETQDYYLSFDYALVTVDTPSHSLSTPKIVGIAVGCAVALGCFIYGMVLLWKRFRVTSKKEISHKLEGSPVGPRSSAERMAEQQMRSYE